MANHGNSFISFKSSWTYETQFNNITGWTGVSGAFTHSTDKIAFNVDTSLSNMYYDHTTISDTAWVLRFPLLLGTLVNGSALQQIYWGLNSAAGSFSANQDSVGFGIRFGEGGTSYRNIWGNAASMGANVDAYTETASSADDHGIQLIRTTATNVEGKIMNSAFSSTTETNNTTIDSTVQSLRYSYGVTLNEGTDTNVIGDFTAWYFANAVTVPP